MALKKWETEVVTPLFFGGGGVGLVFFVAKGFSDFQIFTPKRSPIQKTFAEKIPTGYDGSGQESGEGSERGGGAVTERHAAFTNSASRVGGVHPKIIML